MSATAECRVVIVDDHAMVRESMALALARADDLHVVGTASTVAEARRIVASTRPDVVVVDYSLPDGTGVQLAEELHALDRPTRTVLVTAREDTEAAAEAVAAGCAGFVHKSADLGDLAEGLRRVWAGEVLFDAATLAAAISWLNRPKSDAVSLTDREVEVLSRLAEGRSTSEISQQLFLSHHTVRNHVRNILAKLHARSQLEAVVIGSSMGIVTVGRDAAR